MSDDLARMERHWRRFCALVLLGVAVVIIPVQQIVDEQRSAQESPDVFYVPTGQLLRRLAMGHEGLLANVYWTRAVQYFGGQRRAHRPTYERLGPLLRITTTLDPRLIIAYRYGAIFLAGRIPDGAGRPEEALHLLRRGIVANPDYWRLWQDLGFIYYWDLRDYERAARAFRAGSERPGALVWMKVLAASVAARGGDPATSRLLWSEIYRHADNEQIRQSAESHLMALRAQEDLEQLDQLLRRYETLNGQTARSWNDLLAVGLLASIPIDPSGVPYVIEEGGRAGLSERSKVNLRLVAR